MLKDENSNKKTDALRTLIENGNCFTDVTVRIYSPHDRESHQFVCDAQYHSMLRDTCNIEEHLNSFSWNTSIHGKNRLSGRMILKSFQAVQRKP